MSDKKLKMSDPCNGHSHGKEFYSVDVDFSISAYRGRIYYTSPSYGPAAYICSSDLEGGDIRIIAEVEDDFGYSYIHVNATGIYLYTMWDGDRLLVQHFGFTGSILSECREVCEDGHRVSNVYIYDNDVYYVYGYHTDDISRCQIRCMHVDTGAVETLYEKATSIEKLYATEDRLIFLARYENEERGQSGKGWMLLDLKRKSIVCISNPYCSPENVIDSPDMYDSESRDYNENCDYDRNIVFVDLDRDIFWTERMVMEQDGSGSPRPVWYREARPLSGDRDRLAPGMPVWKMLEGISSSKKEYFDGTYHYYAESYCVFKSSDKFGNISDWSAGNDGHGECEGFKVTGGYLFLDVAAKGEEQYPLAVRSGRPIRKSWFNDELPQNAIDSFSGRYEKNPDTKPPKAKNAMASEGESIGHDLVVEKTIGQTDIRYNICTFGSKFHIGFGVSVTIIINGNTYQCRTHNTAKGRIDGMKRLYAENGIGVGDVLRATYVAESHEILLEKIS